MSGYIRKKLRGEEKGAGALSRMLSWESWDNVWYAALLRACVCALARSGELMHRDGGRGQRRVSYRGFWERV